MAHVWRFAFALCVLATRVHSQPGCNDNTCKLPDCRCSDNNVIPGNIAVAKTPQIILVTFQNALNSANVDLYTDIFKDIANPNDCPAKGTFFIQKQFTDFNIVKELADDLHEIGGNSLTGAIPKNQEEWDDLLKGLHDSLADAGIAESKVLGFRAPNLAEGGDEEFNSIDQNDYLYDASCVSLQFSTPGTYRWPYTYDFIPGPTCEAGTSPTKVHEGKWQFLMTEFEFAGEKCATPEGCTKVMTKEDAKDLLSTSFDDHHSTNKAPYVLPLGPLWVSKESNVQATQEFLKDVRDNNPDVWILTMQQALKWVQTPTPLEDLNDFEPWLCP